MGNIFLTIWKTNALMKIFTIVMVDDFRKHVLQYILLYLKTIKFK